MVLAAAVGFGTLAIFGKFAEEAGVNTTTLLTFRFVIGAGMLWVGLAAWGRLQLPSGRNLYVALALGVLYAAFSAFFFWGLLYVPAGVAGIAFYTYPALVYVISIRFLGERLFPRKLLALVFALGGVALVTGGDTAGVDRFGVGLVVLAACGYAGYITGSRAAVAAIGPDVLAGTALVASALSFLGFGLLSGRLFVPAGSEQWMPILGTAILGTTLPLFLYVSGLERIEASRAAITSTAEPVVTVLLGIVLLGEAFTPSLVVGGALVLVGVVLIQTDPRALLDRSG